MHMKKLLPATLVAVVSAQETSMNLTAALSSAPELTQLLEVLSNFEQLVSDLSGTQNITVLAPSNDAFEEFASGPMGELLNDAAVVQAVLSYHILNGTYYADNVTETPVFIPTSLTNESYTNVTGGQVVKAMAMDGDVTFYSGLMDNSSVVQADIMYENGVVHVIDRLLTIPPNVSTTVGALNRTSLVGALRRAELVETVDSTPDVTIFAPTNEAFQSIGSSLANISDEDLANTLGYHVIAGTVGYSTALEDGISLETTSGDNVTITIEEDNVFVNSAQVVLTDVLVGNGVVHCIDNVLNPANATAAPDSSATSQGPAFSDASSATDVPYTSGVPTPTSVIDGADGGASPTSAEDMAMPIKTGAIGVAALFGGAAVVYNI